MEKTGSYVDVRFRFFLLDRLYAQGPFTFFDIKCTVMRDSGKTISDRRLRDILDIMTHNRLLKKIRMDEPDVNGSLLLYQISKKGIHKWQYYKKKLNQ